MYRFIPIVIFAVWINVASMECHVNMFSGGARKAAMAKTSIRAKGPSLAVAGGSLVGAMTYKPYTPVIKYSIVEAYNDPGAWFRRPDVMKTKNAPVDKRDPTRVAKGLQLSPRGTKKCLKLSHKFGTNVVF